MGEKMFTPFLRQTVKDAYKAIHDFALRIRLSHWHLISTAPCNHELELRIVEGGKVVTLEFPCLQTNVGTWNNVDLGSAIRIQPVQWRVWQRDKSPEPHRSQLKLNGRSTSRLVGHMHFAGVPVRARAVGARRGSFLPGST